MVMRERRKRIYRRRIPYGMQNFEEVIKRDCYYVDKTPFIEDIEESNIFSSTSGLAVLARPLPSPCSKITMMSIEIRKNNDVQLSDGAQLLGQLHPQ